MLSGRARSVKHASDMSGRAGPDVVVCTPGRMVDHLTNSAGTHLDNLETLVLDEADRLLEMGFTEEVRIPSHPSPPRLPPLPPTTRGTSPKPAWHRAQVDQIVRACPGGRQTLLFSATFNAGVEELMKLSLRRPVRVLVDERRTVAPRLTQEFVRVRADDDGGRATREALVISLLSRT